MQVILHLVTVLWFLVAGFNGHPRDYKAQCEPTAIWYYDGANEQWLGWFPQFEDPNYVTIPEAYRFMLDWMFADSGYWVACKK